MAERDVFEAREALILRRETHLDQLADKLREPRVRRVIEPLLAGGDAEYGERDFEYVRDLGLVGSRRVDLLVVWPRERGREDRIVVECKLVREGRSLSRTVDEGLEQTRRYMDISGTDEGHLVVFDMRPDRSWAERVFREERDWQGARITVWGA